MEYSGRRGRFTPLGWGAAAVDCGNCQVQQVFLVEFTKNLL